MRQINIKKTSLLDSLKYFSLRNNPKNRQNSSNTKKIRLKDHEDWFKKNYKNKYYYTCYKGKSKIGYIRGDELSDTIIVSIAIDAKNQNKKIGTICLKLFEKKITENSILIARVMKKNLISIKFFEKNGFSELYCKKNITTYYKVKNSKTDNYLDAIDKIERIRNKNNINWMNILRIAFRYSPKETSRVFRQIYSSDKIINNLTKKLY